jgi:hypothetical protein
LAADGQMGAGKERLGAAQGGDEAARAGLEQFSAIFCIILNTCRPMLRFPLLIRKKNIDVAFPPFSAIWLST